LKLEGIEVRSTTSEGLRSVQAGALFPISGTDFITEARGANVLVGTPFFP